MTMLHLGSAFRSTYGLRLCMRLIELSCLLLGVGKWDAQQTYSTVFCINTADRNQAAKPVMVP